MAIYVLKVGCCIKKTRLVLAHVKVECNGSYMGWYGIVNAYDVYESVSGL